MGEKLVGWAISCRIRLVAGWSWHGCSAKGLNIKYVTNWGGDFNNLPCIFRDIKIFALVDFKSPCNCSRSPCNIFFTPQILFVCTSIVFCAFTLSLRLSDHTYHIQIYLVQKIALWKMNIIEDGRISVLDVLCVPTEIETYKELKTSFCRLVLFVHPDRCRLDKRSTTRALSTLSRAIEIVECQMKFEVATEISNKSQFPILPSDRYRLYANSSERWFQEKKE